jgi:hypothetical protein
MGTIPKFTEKSLVKLSPENLQLANKAWGGTIIGVSTLACAVFPPLILLGGAALIGKALLLQKPLSLEKLVEGEIKNINKAIADLDKGKLDSGTKKELQRCYGDPETVTKHCIDHFKECYNLEKEVCFKVLDYNYELNQTPVDTENCKQKKSELEEAFKKFNTKTLENVKPQFVGEGKGPEAKGRDFVGYFKVIDVQNDVTLKKSTIIIPSFKTAVIHEEYWKLKLELDKKLETSETKPQETRETQETQKTQELTPEEIKVGKAKDEVHSSNRELSIMLRRNNADEIKLKFNVFDRDLNKLIDLVGKDDKEVQSYQKIRADIIEERPELAANTLEEI